MGKIEKNLPVYADKGKINVIALFDSGAGRSLIRRDVVNKVVQHLLKLHKPIIFNGVNGKEAFSASNYCGIEVEMKGKLLSGLFYIIDKMPREMIIGVDFMQGWDIKLDLKNEDYTVGLDPQDVEIANF
ncbi:MAG: retroviral-like aspartic protease [Cytophagales bacterium]|nr:retroviral-like aspartic protease [Cytophagales bacterium]